MHPYTGLMDSKNTGLMTLFRQSEQNKRQNVIHAVVAKRASHSFFWVELLHRNSFKRWFFCEAPIYHYRVMK